MPTAALSERRQATRLTPAELAELDHPTPYVLIDLAAVDRAYEALGGALPGV
jgi:hypothetical protein